MLYLILSGLFITMNALLALSFISNKKSLISSPFILLSSLSGLLCFLLYALTGSATGLEHYNLQMTLQKMGGLETIIRKIEKRVAEHPEDKRGQEILKKIQHNVLSK